MPVTSIRGDEYISLEYRPRSSRTFEFEIDADRPVKSYIVGPKNLRRFVDGSKNFRYWGGFPDPRKRQRQKIWIPFSGPVYLVIANPDHRETAQVQYQVYY
jgi:hypothetical protein